MLPEEQLADGTDFGSGDVLRDLKWMVSRLVDNGFPRVIVIRHTKPDEPVQVARVIVPGIEGYMFSYAAMGNRAAKWSTALMEGTPR